MSVEKATATLLRSQEKPYTTVPSKTINLIRDGMALAIYTYLQSKPDYWIIRAKEIQTHFDIGRDKYRNACRYLREIGLLDTIITRNEKGMITNNQTVIHYEPDTEALKNRPSVEKKPKASDSKASSRSPEKPSVGKPAPLVTSCITSNLSKDIKPLCVSFEKFWEIYPKKTERKKCEAIWKRLKVTPELFEKIKKHLSLAYVEMELQYVPHAKTYLNGERWTDQIIPKASKPKEKTYNLPFDGSALDNFARKNDLPAPNGGESSEHYRARLIAELKRRDSMSE